MILYMLLSGSVKEKSECVRMAKKNEGVGRDLKSIYLDVMASSGTFFFTFLSLKFNNNNIIIVVVIITQLLVIAKSC